MAGNESSSFSIPQQHNTSSMDDSDSDYERENIRPRGLTGLQNLGNTCYLNSALQSLSNCPPLTQYFLDCESLIKPDKSPMLAKSYLKLITELWHKKRPSYVVPSGIVSGIKAVHPMFRGFTQQDAQEFLRCLMDQLHEELKSPVVLSDDSEDENEDEDDENGSGMCREDNANNTNNARQQGDVTDGVAATNGGAGRNMQQDPKSPLSEAGNRRPSFDSLSSQSELDYETCDSGLSSERSSNAGPDIGSGDENGSDFNDSGGGTKVNDLERSRKMSAMSAGSGTEEYYTPAMDMVANTKEMKETANLLEKETEMRRGKVYMEGGDSKEAGSIVPPAPAVAPDATTTAPKDVEIEGTKASMAPSPSPKASNKPKKPQNIRHDSIISQTFDGKILSSVRCLNCETVSTTKETFQDLSLPIPSKDHLHMLHSGYPSSTVGGVSPPKGGACGEVNQGWLTSMLSWMKSWFVGPTVTLQDCLAAFFSADELKGDNMYSCGKCKKLRNGLKYSKVLELPEILSIHLKRFRHEFYSSKISTYISFPLEGLDMDPYADKDCRNEVTTYDLVAIICHHGTAGGGHYTAYCLNHLNGQWYEFDDQYVTEVDVSQVQNCEAYVLFYRKSNKKIEPIRQKIMEMDTDEKSSILKFYISRPWLSRFQTFAEPGPITNMDFLCKHGGVPPGKIPVLNHLIAEIPQDAWEVLYNRFGGGMVCNHLFACKACESELERLIQRQRSEKEMFIQLNEEFQDDEYTGPVYAISMAWFREWECFVREKTDVPPDTIDNSRITVYRNGQPTLRQSSDHGHLSKDMWLFLHRIYGGGPEILFRQTTGTLVKSNNSTASANPPNSQTSQQHQHQPSGKPTLASLAAAAAAPVSPLSSSSSSSSAYPTATSSTSSSQGLSPLTSAPTTVSSTSPPPSSPPPPSSTPPPPSSTPPPPSSTPPPPSSTPNTGGTTLPSTSKEDLSNVHTSTSSHSHSPVPSRPAEIQLRADRLETHPSPTDTKKDCGQPDVAPRSPTAPVIQRVADQTIQEDLDQSSQYNCENNEPYANGREESTSDTKPDSSKSDCVGNDDNDDHDTQNIPTTPVTSDSREETDSPSSGNDSCSLALSSQPESQEENSCVHVAKGGGNSTKRLSHVSQDSGISSESYSYGSVEDQTNVKDTIVDNKGLEVKGGETDRKATNVTEHVNGPKDSDVASVEFGDKVGVVVNQGSGGDGGAQKTVGSNKGRNRKKKGGKPMEVTRI